jgi:hypothetical protein
MSNQQNINLVNALNKPKANGPGGMVVVGGDMRTVGGNQVGGGGMAGQPPHTAMNNVGGSDNNSLNTMNSNSSLQAGGNNPSPQVSSMIGGPGLVSMAPVNSMSSDMGAGGTVVTSMGGGGPMGPGGLSQQQMRPMGLQQQGMLAGQQQVMLNGPMVRHVGMSAMGNNGLQQQQIRQPNLIGTVGQPRMISGTGVRMQAMVSVPEFVSAHFT